MAAAAFTLAGNSAAAPGDFDPAFGSGGTIRAPLAAGATVHAVFVEAGGSLIALSVAGAPPRLVTHRWLADGSADPGHGTAGRVDASLPAVFTGRHAIRQPGGKFLVAGALGQPGSTLGAVARLDTTGLLDGSFGSAGVATLPSPVANNTELIDALSIQPDGSILAAGRSYKLGQFNACFPTFVLARFLASGAPDPTFGTAGRLADGHASLCFRVSMAIDGAGRTYVATHHPVDVDITRIGRHDAAGRIDFSFAGTSFAGTMPLVAIHDGKALALGGDSSLRRFGEDGALDRSFGTAGASTPARGSAAGTALLAASTGGIVSAASWGSGGIAWRLQPSGAIDAAFGAAGGVTLAFAPTALAVDSQDRVLAAAQVGGELVLARLLGAATPAGVDITPETYAFAPVANAWPATQVESASATITGIDALATVHVAGGEVSIGCNGTYSAAARTIVPGEALCARHVSSSAAGSSTTTTVVVGGVAASFTSTTAASAVAAQVASYYRTILRRGADAQGQAYWEGEAARIQALGADPDETWYSMAASFFRSAEYAALARDAAGYVTDLYDTFLARSPDGAGLSYWTGLLAQGMPREVVLVSFLFSPEFAGRLRSIFGHAAARAEVDTVVDFYRGLLGRLPDSDGFRFWLERFRQAQCAGSAAVAAEAEAISRAFALSGEYMARARADSEYVGDLYNTFLRRGGDLEGVRYWIDQLSAGSPSRENARRAFVASPEFQQRVERVVAEGCLR